MKKQSFAGFVFLFMAALVGLAYNFSPSFNGEQQRVLSDIYDLFPQKASSATISGGWTHSGVVTNSGNIVETAAVTHTLGGTNNLTGPTTLTGQDLVLATAGKGLVVKTGANGRLGSIDFVSGGLEVISNTTVTANTQCFLQATSAAAGAGVMTCTNEVGVGVHLIPPTAQTNSYSYLLIEGN